MDRDGKFVADVMLDDDDDDDDEYSCYILNYNSPGTAEALLFAAHVINQLSERGILDDTGLDVRCGQWNFAEIISGLQ